MAEKVVLEAEVKSNIGDVAKDAKSAVGEFELMGVSLNSIKAGFVGVAKQAKLAFGSIKAGLISTGIGALVVAVGSLVAWFTKTKEGGEALERVFKSMGAAVNVIVGRIAEFGRGLKELVTGGGFEALQKMMGAFKGIGDELKNDISQTYELTAAQQRLVDSERDLRVETAERRAEIEKLKMTAEDVTKSEEERLTAAQEAFDIETNLLDRRTANAEKALKIQQDLMEVRKIDGRNTEEDLEKEAELQIAIADITSESLTKQIELNNKLNSIRAEMRTEEEATFNERMDEMVTIGGATEELILPNNKVLDNYLKNNEARKKSDEAIAAVQEENKEKNLAAASQLAGALSGLAGENKELAAASAIIDTYAGANKAFAQGGFAGFATGAAIIAAGLANLKKIYDTDIPGGGGGGMGSGAAAVAQAPAPQMMSGAFTLGGGQAPAALQAFVVTDEMTNSQNQLANIRRRSTL